MPFNINRFRSNFEQSDLTGFELEILAPPLVVSPFAAQMKFFCKAVNLPSTVLQVVPNRQSYGPPENMVTDRAQENLTLQFYLTYGYEQRRFFEQWVDAAYDPVMFRVAYRDDYATEIRLNKHNLDGSTEAIYKFNQAFPVLVSEVSMDWDAQNTTPILTVDISYSYYTRIL